MAAWRRGSVAAWEGRGAVELKPWQAVDQQRLAVSQWVTAGGPTRRAMLPFATTRARQLLRWCCTSSEFGREAGESCVGQAHQWRGALAGPSGMSRSTLGRIRRPGDEWVTGGSRLVPLAPSPPPLFLSFTAGQPFLYHPTVPHSSHGNSRVHSFTPVLLVVPPSSTSRSFLPQHQATFTLTMRYSSTVVLSTLAAGSAAASHLAPRHAGFHSRRQAEVKRTAGPDLSNVDWKNVAYDLHGVDWSKVDYSGHSDAPAPASAAPAAPSPSPEQKQPEYQAAPQPAASSAPASPAPAPAPSHTDSSGLGGIADSILGQVKSVVADVFSGVEAIASKVGCKVGKNDKSNNGGIWIGDDSAWKATFTNEDSSDSVIYCWRSNADGVFTGMSVNVHVPDISVGLKKGESVTLSFAANVPAACAPVYSTTQLALFGGLDNTWWEVTFGNSGAFDVSRNVNMNGSKISSQGSKCKSDMDTCVFKCKDSNAKSCEKGSDYDLFNCAAGNGGGGGYDATMAGTGGGCAMGSDGETVHVSYSQ